MMRKTKSIVILIEIFDKKQGAISVVSLVERLINKMNKTTVYRALEKLEHEGILHSFLDKDGLKWYAKCQGCSTHHHEDTHPHFQCKDCGEVECLPIGYTIPSIDRYKVDFTNVLLVGQCSNCL